MVTGCFLGRTPVYPPRTLIVLDFFFFSFQKNYLDRPDPIDFMSVVVDTSVHHIYDDFSRLLFLRDHREPYAPVNALPDQFRFLLAVCLPNLKGSVGLILSTSS